MHGIVGLKVDDEHLCVAVVHRNAVLEIVPHPFSGIRAEDVPQNIRK